MVTLKRGDCEVTMLTGPDPYETSFIDVEAPGVLVFRLTDEPKDGQMFVEFVDQGSEAVTMRLSLEDMRHLLDAAEAELRRVE